MTETQSSVTTWGEQTFGPASTPDVLVARAAVEFDELMEAARAKDKDEVAHEMADVLIILYRVATIFGFDLNAAVDAKMRINRARKWAPKGDGTGSHIKE